MYFFPIYLVQKVKIVGMDDFKLLPLTQDKFAKIDAEDFDVLSSFKWSAACCSGIFYAVRWSPVTKGNEYLHRVICKPEEGESIDHINGDGLDNRRSNLRPCNAANNGWNRRKSVNNTTGYKGVSWNARKRKYKVTIMHNGASFHLGYTHDLQEAAKRYTDKATELFAEFARAS